MKDHKQSAERIKAVTKAIVKRLVLKGKLPPPPNALQQQNGPVEVIDLHAGHAPNIPKE